MRTSIVVPECGWTASAEHVTGISPSYGGEAETYAVSEAREKHSRVLGRLMPRTTVDIPTSAASNHQPGL